jgi:hypothetical protein
MWSSPLQETMRFAMRWRDTRSRFQSDVLHPPRFSLFWFGGLERPCQAEGRVVMWQNSPTLDDFEPYCIIILSAMPPLQLHPQCFLCHGCHADPAVDVALSPVVSHGRGYGDRLCEFGTRFMNLLVS